MAQSVGEEPLRDGGDSPEDIQEYFGGDMDAATEYYGERRKESLYAENQRLRARVAELEGDDYED